MGVCRKDRWLKDSILESETKKIRGSKPQQN